jgi:protein ImuB
MLVLAVLPRLRQCLPALAEACLAFSPQVALGEEAVFAEIGASHQVISPEEVLTRLAKLLGEAGIQARVATAGDLPSALAFARYGTRRRESLPVEALSDYLSPFRAAAFSPAALFRKLGVETMGDFLQVPRAEIPARFGREGWEAYERYLRAEQIAWPRFVPEEKIMERADFDFASRIENLEPLLFLLRHILHRTFLRLNSRREKIVDFDLIFHLNRFAADRARVSEVRLPLPQSEQKALLQLLQERLGKELEKRPLEEALEGVSLLVRATAPAHDSQRNFFSKAEEEREVFSSLMARLRERASVFSATPSPRLLPEASWRKTVQPEKGELVETPLRPLRLLPSPLPLRRQGEILSGIGRQWAIRGFHGPERLKGEWWLGGFEREYYRVDTEAESLWVFRTTQGLFLHGVFD